MVSTTGLSLKSLLNRSLLATHRTSLVVPGTTGKLWVAAEGVVMSSSSPRHSITLKRRLRPFLEFVQATMPPNLGFDRWPRRPADGTPTCAHHPVDTERQHAAWRARNTAVVVVRTTMSAVSSQSSRCPRTKKVVRRPKLPHQIFPAQQHALRLENTLIVTPSCSGLPIPLARLEIWGHLARRPGRRAHRPTHARGDLAPRPLPLYT